MAAGGKERVVLIAMDGSNYSDYAFEWYWTNIHRDNDKVILLHVPEYHTVVQSPMVMADVTVITEMMKDEEKRIKEFLEKLGQKLKEKKVGGKVKSVGGNPGRWSVKSPMKSMPTLLSQEPGEWAKLDAHCWAASATISSIMLMFLCLLQDTRMI